MYSSFSESDSSTIEKFVQFVFGEPTMPPQPVYVKFNRPGKSLPDADACTGTISLPIDHKMKKDFTKSLDIVLNFQHKGFGRCWFPTVVILSIQHHCLCQHLGLYAVVSCVFYRLGLFRFYIVVIHGFLRMYRMQRVFLFQPKYVLNTKVV